MADRQDFGVLYGQKTTGDTLLIYSGYEDSKSSPKTGDFIVLSPRNEQGDKFLARVEAEVYDEDPIFRSQDKTLVAVHYARIAERELSERDKQKMFSYTYNVRILGTFTYDGQRIKFATAVRRLPTVAYHARHLNPLEVSQILNSENENGATIGNLCIGVDVQTDKGPILFDTNRLKSTRTMVFAQSGFGKTNLIKVMLYHTIGDTSYGKLIFDLNGEYFLKGTETFGLGDINEQKIRDNVVVYSDKNIPPAYNNRFVSGGRVQLNMHKHLSIGDVLNFGTGYSEVMKAFLYYLDENAPDFIKNIDDYANNPQKLHIDYPDFWGQYKEKEGGASAQKTVMAIRKRIRHLIDEGTGGNGLHSTSSNLLENVLEQLAQGKTVIVDLSLKDNMDASIISTILIRNLFERNKANFTSGKDSDVIKAVVFVEEAQNVLSDEFVKSNANPFVRVAKEGRKFGLGLVAITQRPSAISEEIRTQAENFFAFHMGNSDDIHALVRSNVNYDGVISRFIQTETIKGNLYMVSSDQAFVLPLRVSNFEEMIKDKVYKAQA